MTEFQIKTVDLAGGTHLVRLIGKLDREHADAAREILTAIAGSTVVVNLSDLTFIDSAGVEALQAAKRRIEAQGDSVKFWGAQPTVRRVLGGAGVEDWLND